MAYLVKRGNVFHLCHRATPNGKRTRFSTELRDDIPGHVRQANALRDRYTAMESSAASNVPRRRSNEQWLTWVPGWAAMKYPNKGTHRRWESMWRTLKIFFDEFKIHTPRELTRKHCLAYLTWRVTPTVPAESASAEEKEAYNKLVAHRRKIGLHNATHNTALLEMQALGVIMKEATYNDFADANPCRELGVGRRDVKKPIDLNDDMLKDLETCIHGVKEPAHTVLWRSYLVARYHGVRLHETRVNPMRDVELNGENGSYITFCQKGGRVRVKPLHPKLFALFTELKSQGAIELFKCPANFNAFWWSHIHRWGLQEKYGKVCFHSLRFVVQNKLRRAGINDEIKRRYLSHETGRDAHEGYSSIQIDEMRVCHAVL